MKIKASPLGSRLNPGASAFSQEILPPSRGYALGATPFAVRFHSPADLPNLHSGAKFEALHVWSAAWGELEELAARQGDWVAALSVDERQRARRFLRVRDAGRYRLGRAWLRRLLGQYLDLRPAAICFEYGAHGKPFLLAGGVPSTLRFNVAHSGEIVTALAFMLVLEDPDGRRIRLYTREKHGPEIAGQKDHPWMQL